MKKIVLSTAVLSALALSNVIELEDIDVETSVPTEVVADVSGEEIKSADLGESLYKNISSVSLVRRSAIANDIRVRGQRKDNINVTIDGAKIHGACPNRMDPPISHVLTNNVESVEVNEGPFSVEDFGVLSADVKVKTKKPEEGFKGELNLGFGSFGFNKQAVTISGGDDKVRYLISTSKESGEQYEDGNGDDFAEQIAAAIAAGSSDSKYAYKTTGLDAFEKETFMGKVFINLDENQELNLSYTANRSDNILYPSTPMDALYDDSNIYTAEYTAKDLSENIKELNIKMYKSEVDHPMDNSLRVSSNMMLMSNNLTTEATGVKIEEKIVYDNHTIKAGIDSSTRNWDGYYHNNISSINDVETKNRALFVNDKIKLDKYLIEVGARYDNTDITSKDTSFGPKKNYNEVNGYLLATYNKDNNTKYYAGFGKSSRVPDGKELVSRDKSNNLIGDPDLKNTVNNEFDMGIEKQYENATMKFNAFYSNMSDYIIYNADITNFENIDAKIYGFDVSGTYISSATTYVDYSLAYQVGTKENSTQLNDNLPDIAPLKMNIALNYDYTPDTSFRAEVVAADTWDNYDASNGEVELDSYAVLNLKATKEYKNNIELIVGIDNVFDKTYAVSNSYKEIALLSGTTSGDVMLMNEPGRYFYTNLRYKF